MPSELPQPAHLICNIIKLLLLARRKKRKQKTQATLVWTMFIETHSLAALDFAYSKQEGDKILRRYGKCSGEEINPLSSHVSN